MYIIHTHMNNNNNADNDMRVTKRDGNLEEMSFDKILNRIKKLGQEVGIQINYSSLVMKVIDQLYDKIETAKIDELAAEQCASLSTQHPDYGVLASRIVISNHQKNTESSFSNIMKNLYEFKDIHGTHKPLIAEYIWKFIEQKAGQLNDVIDHSRDYLIDFFGFKTLERAYLFKLNNKVVERVQHMWLRVAVGIHVNPNGGAVNNSATLRLIKETYDLMSQKYFTHATPTLFNSGTPRPQLSSCYLIAMEDDSLDGIYNTLKDCAFISKWAGGIGLHIHNIRAKGTHIHGTNGTSNGIVPMLRVFNNTARYIDQGGGKRNGSFAIYLEPWHPDVEDFLEMKKNHGDEESKARDLFYALWISDLFMERVKENGKWSLFCPNECPGLSDVYGEKFVELYTTYENSGKARKTVNARDLWFKILDAQMETGTPYLLFKDAANKKSNQQNLGTIKSSNLCVAPETMILTDKGHIEIQNMEGQTVNVWNGEEFSEVNIVKTGIDQDLIDVYTDDGSMLSCTPYHKFYIQENYSEKSIKMVEAKDLTPNDKIMKCEFPVIDGTDKMLYPYTHGFFCGDGTYGNVSEKEEQNCKFNALSGHYFCKRHIDFETEGFLNNNIEELKSNEIIKCIAKSYKKKPMSYLYGDKKDLLQYMEYRSHSDEINGRIVLQLPLDINEKFDIPSFNCNLKDKLDWFAGYCDADGTISRNGENEQLQVASINYEFLKNVKLLLQTCGINPKIKLSQNRDKSYLPDGKGGYKYFDVKPIYRLLITSCDLYNLRLNGFSPKRLKCCSNKPARDAKQFIKILKVEYNNRIDDTYCFTEPKKHMGIFNGILTGQCTEILEYSDDKETAVCNLASIALPTFVNEKTKIFDYEKLHEVAKVVTNNLNKVIDVNFYPTPKTERSNMLHRPIGIGVQGLADAFILMDIPFHSEEAKEVNKLIFETIYHAALEKSNEIAIAIKERYLSQVELCDHTVLYEMKYTNGLKYGLKPSHLGAYQSFEDSPASKGILQFDMWDVQPTSGRYDWDALKQSIVAHGLRNSLLLAPMPTASTSQILGFNECFEPFTSNLYSRRTLAGEFVVVNKYLMKELIELGLWNEQIKNNIIANKGSVQQLSMLSEHIKNKYKIVWEMPMKHLIDMSADRGAFICQSQSMNLWVEDPTYNTLTSMHFYSWKKGLKTGIYYLRRKAKHQAQQFTIEPEKKKVEEKDEICEMCSA
uniref:ribonucleoside-diphosphate reductase n=1 Tax=viral metagenome TaxID=1070528 RepID=A0A6C0JF35_9ZZZZ